MDGIRQSMKKQVLSKEDSYDFFGKGTLSDLNLFNQKRDRFIKRVNLIISLALNDFKSKYASSQLGILWAFFKPVVQACVYVFVFTIIARAAPANNQYPYAFWLLPGMIAWFFFSDGIMSGANALLEYSYLVKKIKFDIGILPTVKVISSGIVHCFFVLFVLFLYLLWGLPLCWTMIQIPYYMVCTFSIVVALSKINCALVPFFRDFLQLLEIILMVLMWACPVMWDVSMLPEKIVSIFKLNPLYYVIEGYRQSFMGGGWFFNKPWMTVYYWGFVLLLWYLGNKLFSRLQVHFADIM